MDSKISRAKIVFVSGHLDLTVEEFNEHYVPELRELYLQGYSFVVGDAPGCDLMAQQFLTDIDRGFRNKRPEVTVFHMLEKPRNLYCRYMDEPFPTRGGYGTDETRDAAMTAASDIDVAWVRPGKRKNTGTAKNLVRRLIKDYDARLAEIAAWPEFILGEGWDDGQGRRLCAYEVPKEDGGETRVHLPQELVDRLQSSWNTYWKAQEELQRLVAEQGIEP